MPPLQNVAGKVEEKIGHYADMTMNHVVKMDFQCSTYMCSKLKMNASKSYTGHVKDSVSVSVGRTERWIIPNPKGGKN